MGAAAFQNEVINQLAEAYLTYQQQQQRERGLKNWRIQPDKYRDELQKVKAYIATHNVYGVDLNPTAIELGKLSLWLNVIHKDMETPFFANRLAVGNAVIGAWLKVYSKEDVKGITERNSRTLKPNKWWEKAPSKVKFFSNRVNRSVNDVYHFLLPDANMLGVRSIREQKQAHSSEFARMTLILKDWTKPISEYDFQILQRLSGKIDILLKEYYTDQISIDKYTNNRNEVWDGIDHSDSESLFKEEEQAESYAKKQQLFDTRYRRDNAYRKLKLAMDYWCALWFWEYEDASDLPTREEYWADIEALLDVDNDKLDTRTRQALERYGSLFAAEDGIENSARMTEEESEIVTKTQEELLTSSHGSATLFAHEDSLRLKIADRLAKRYRFFHPMLEFIEVFWLRDGFDIICGNPPWIKLEFDEQGILSEKYPEVAIRKVSAPNVRKMRDKMFLQIPSTEKMYRSEEIETACCSIFMNAYCNYPLLVGQANNLYKCVIENGFSQLSNDGFMGLLHPETIYDDPNGQPLRIEIYPRLRFHFQYQNELKLFSEVHNETLFSSNIYCGTKNHQVEFISVNNLFHPSTLDSCFVHDGHGKCGGIKDEHNNWNLNAHKNRLVTYRQEELRILAKVFENSEQWESTKLTSIHAKDLLGVLRTLSLFPKHLRDFSNIISLSLNEAGAVQNGIMKRFPTYPDMSKFQMIYTGPLVYVCNPLYKTPRSGCKTNRDFDNINLSEISDNYITRTNYIPIISQTDYENMFVGFNEGQTASGEPIYGKWLSYYKLGFRRMLSQTGERTLSGAILPPFTNHIDGIISCAFIKRTDLIEFTGLASSLPLDFYLKVVGAANLHKERLESFPLGITDKYKPALFSRALLLNCLTTAYTNLWQEMWDEAYKDEAWSIEDKRLKPFKNLNEKWSWETPLRNYFERRQALVEIDVISAMALGLSLHDLEMIYTIQFPVLQQNENDTWYDAEGKIVFTCSKGLTGVGLDRKRNNSTGMLGWEDIRGEQIDENTYAGTSPTHTHTIEPAKSELYGGQQQTYVAPYTRCDRIADYRKAWAHFEKIFK